MYVYIMYIYIYVYKYIWTQNHIEIHIRCNPCAKLFADKCMENVKHLETLKMTAYSVQLYNILYSISVPISSRSVASSGSSGVVSASQKMSGT